MKNIKLQTADVTRYISCGKFRDIVRFVLENGDRQTYCNMYNNSPRYPFEGFQLFLNPIHQEINLTMETLSNNPDDYNSITIYDRSLKTKSQYYRIRVNGSKIIYKEYHCKNENEFKLMKRELLKIYFPIINQAITEHHK